MWMSRIADVFLVAMMLLFATFAETNGQENVTRIVGGSNAAPNEGTFVVRLSFDPSGECTGAIIGRRHILTAGHCVKDQTGGRIYGGSVNRDDPNAIVTYMSRLHRHPKYGTALGGYDLGIVEVASDLDLSGRQTSIPLTKTEINFNVNGFQFGWSRCGSMNIRVLQKIPVSFLTKEVCRNRGGNEQYPQLLCVDPGAGSSCGGDSGGPVISGGRLVGIHTSGANNLGDPITSQNVYYYLNWINSIISN